MAVLILPATEGSSLWLWCTGCMPSKRCHNKVIWITPVLEPWHDQCLRSMVTVIVVVEL